MATLLSTLVKSNIIQYNSSAMNSAFTRISAHCHSQQFYLQWCDKNMTNSCGCKSGVPSMTCVQSPNPVNLSYSFTVCICIRNISFYSDASAFRPSLPSNLQFQVSSLRVCVCV